LDLDASQHMLPMKILFCNYQVLNPPRLILLGDNSSYNIISFGSILLRLLIGQTLLIKDVLFVPGLAKNLLSVTQITTIRQTSVLFTRDQCVITTISPTSNKKLILHIHKDGNLFSLGIGIEPSNTGYSATSLSKPEIKMIYWHYHLGYLNLRFLSNMHNHSLVVGLPSIKNLLPVCKSCLYGKQSKEPYSKDPVTQAIEVLALIHTDLCGPMNTPSLEGAIYFLLFMDDFSRYTHVYFLQKKSAAMTHFLQYKTLIERHSNKKILILLLNNGGEFTSHQFNKYY